MLEIGDPLISARRCPSCGEDFLWGHLATGGWVPLDPMPYPTGEYAFAPIKEESWLFRARDLPRYAELSPRDKALIHRAGEDDLFRRALDAPRYRRHSMDCSIEVVQSMRYTLKDLIQQLSNVGLAPFITEGDVFFHD